MVIVRWLSVSKNLNTGRNPSDKEFQEANRVLSLAPVQQRNHPSAVAADQSKLSTSTHTGACRSFISTSHLLAASAGSERFGKPKTRSGIMRRRRAMLMRERLSAMIVAQRRSEPELRMQKPPHNRTETNPATALRFQSGINWRGVVYPTR